MQRHDLPIKLFNICKNSNYWYFLFASTLGYLNATAAGGMTEELLAPISSKNLHHIESTSRQYNVTPPPTFESSSKSKKSCKFAVVLVFLFALLALLILMMLYQKDTMSQHAFAHHTRELSPCLGHTTPYLAGKNVSHIRRHAIILDAGSQGTRMHIYELEFCNDLLLAVHNDFFASVPVSLSSLVSTPSALIIGSKIIDPLLSKALQFIPVMEHIHTPIALRATAGLRLLSQKQVDALLNGARKALSRYPFLLTDDKRPAVELISGTSEAIWAWITINFLYKNLINDCGCMSESASQNQSISNVFNSTINSVIDLGGVSLQIISEISEREAQILARVNARLISERTKPPPIFVHPVHFQEKKHLVFVHSFLNYGYQAIRTSLALKVVNEALGTTFTVLKVPTSTQLSELAHRIIPIIDHPCLPEGRPMKTFLMGVDEENMTLISLKPSSKASWRTCCAETESLFDFDTCDYPQCSFNGVPLPRNMLRRENEVINVSSYFSVVLGPLLKLLPTYGTKRAPFHLWDFWSKRHKNNDSHSHKDISLADIEHIGKIVCSPTFTPTKYPDIFSQFEATHPLVLETICMDLSYIYILMTEGFRLPKTSFSSVLRVEKENIGNAYPCWTLGAAMSLFRAEEH